MFMDIEYLLNANLNLIDKKEFKKIHLFSKVKNTEDIDLSLFDSKIVINDNEKK
jgi:hypothetical protein